MLLSMEFAIMLLLMRVFGTATYAGVYVIQFEIFGMRLSHGHYKALEGRCAIQ